VLQQTRALYQLGVKLGVVDARQQVLSAPVPDTSW
jgi:protease-4